MYQFNVYSHCLTLVKFNKKIHKVHVCYIKTHHPIEEKNVGKAVTKTSNIIAATQKL